MSTSLLNTCQHGIAEHCRLINKNRQIYKLIEGKIYVNGLLL